MASFRAQAGRLPRRTFLALSGATLLPFGQFAMAGDRPLRDVQLVAARGQRRIAPEPHPETPVWSYNGSVPGPEIRVRQGERLRVLVENRLEEETTVHWHGIRVPNAMDGVPHLTQPPILPGGSFVYEFDALDAGTFWYHPHHRSSEQSGRGLAGALIVEEAEPLRVDRELTWVLDDWRLTPQAEISDDFGHPHDMSHAGRIGNTVTINGRIPDALPVRAGERIRLRLVNVANARVFGLEFQDHDPIVVALDGHPVTPHRPSDGRVVLGPAMRVDLVIDMTASPGARADVIDSFYRERAYHLVEIAYGQESLRDGAPSWPVALAPNPLPEPQIDTAIRHEIVFGGGAMAPLVMSQMAETTRAALPAPEAMAEMMRAGRFWFLNNHPAHDHHAPMLTLERDRSYVFAMTNATAWHHPIHLHGHAFRVIARDGRATEHREWQDTVLMSPGERVDVAFVADNPGDWMLHCHVHEHHASGMMGVIRVA